MKMMIYDGLIRILRFHHHEGFVPISENDDLQRFDKAFRFDVADSLDLAGRLRSLTADENWFQLSLVLDSIKPFASVEQVVLM